MKSLTITSTRTAAGKTTVSLGIALNTDKKIGYYKPYGDHLVYSKRLNAYFELAGFPTGVATGNLGNLGWKSKILCKKS